MAGEAPTHLDLMGIRAWGGVALALAVLAGWLGGSLWLTHESTDPEALAQAADPITEAKPSEAVLSRGEGSASQTDLGARRGVGSRDLRSWSVAWNPDDQGLLPVRQDYRISDGAVSSGRRHCVIIEESDHERSVRVPGAKARRWLSRGSLQRTVLVAFQVVDERSVPISGEALLVDPQGNPWGPLGDQPLRFPEGWRGFVLVRGYASTPVWVRSSGDVRVTLYPSADIHVSIASTGVSLVGCHLLLRVFGANVGSNPGRWVRLKGRTKCWLRGLRRRSRVGVELHSELSRFEIVSDQVELEKAVHELELVAYAYSNARVVTSDPSLFGQTLYVAPFYVQDPEQGTLDYRYPWRTLEWDGRGWPLSRLRKGLLDFWVWTDDGRFGRLGEVRLSPGSPRVELAAHLTAEASATLRVRTDALLGGRALEVIVFDGSYVGNPESLVELKGAMPGLRLKTWKVEAGQTLSMSKLWRRPCRIVIRSTEGATLWDGNLDLVQRPTAHADVTLALGGLVHRPRPGPHKGRLVWNVFSKKTGEVVSYTTSGKKKGKQGASAQAPGKTLLLREGSYEIRPQGTAGSARTLQVIAGRITAF